MPASSRYAADPLARLKRHETTAANDAEAEIRKARRAIKRDILELTRELDVGRSAGAREEVLSAVQRRIAHLRRRLERVERAALEYAARAAVRDGSEKTGVEVRYSKERANEMIGVLAGRRGKCLAAVFTDRMAENVIDALRCATVSALRENAVAGGSEKELARALEEKWLGAAKDGGTYEFVDSGGTVWDTKTYVAMNVRTNAMRVYNDSLADTIARATGGDLARVSVGGDPDCRLCFPWEGRILSLTGRTKGFPTYEEARKAGCFHPNCVHSLEPVDELLDADEIELQKAHPMPRGGGGGISPDAADENRYEIDQDRYRRQGMDAEQARVAVDRDNLEASIRAGLLREDARQIVDGMTDAQVTALCKDGNPPAFEPTKQATRADPHAADEKWAHGSRGGTVHIGRAATVERILEVCGVADATMPEPPPTPRMPTDLSALTVHESLGGHSGANATRVSDDDGNDYVMKRSGRGVSAECLANEAMMDAFYRAVGIAVPEAATIRDGGEVVKLSRFVEGGGKELADWWRDASAEERGDMRRRLREGFAADCLLGNWDVAGTGGDNILVDARGMPWRIDNGGAGAYRAMGTPKRAEDWKDGLANGAPSELWTMAESQNNRPYFGGVTPSEICRDIAHTDWTAALGTLDADTRKVVEARIERCREIDRLRVLDSVGVTRENAGAFLRGCRTYGAGAYTQERMDGALWHDKGSLAERAAACDKLFLEDEKNRHGARSDRDKAAFVDYTGSHYESINAFLRKGDAKDKGRAESVRNSIAAEPAKDDIWLQRGNGGEDTIALGTGIAAPRDVSELVGKEWRDKGLMSCTPVKGSGFKDKKVVLNIYCPSGAKMAYARQFSKYAHENEMTLQADSRFVITKAERANGKIYLDISLVSQWPDA